MDVGWCFSQNSPNIQEDGTVEQNESFCQLSVLMSTTQLEECTSIQNKLRAWPLSGEFAVVQFRSFVHNSQ